MPKHEQEIVDLVPGEGGVYSTESTRHSKPKTKPESKKKNDNVKQFFEGMDSGLDFVEEINKRVTRIMKLKH